MRAPDGAIRISTYRAGSYLLLITAPAIATCAIRVRDRS